MINCPICGHEKSRIVETYDRDGFYQRRRVCSNCGNGFVTREYSADAIKTLLTQTQEKALDVATKLFGGR
nr:hypothetical protein [uncultured Mediterranean phage uvMED]